MSQDKRVAPDARRTESEITMTRRTSRQPAPAAVEPEIVEPAESEQTDPTAEIVPAESETDPTADAGTPTDETDPTAVDPADAETDPTADAPTDPTADAGDPLVKPATPKFSVKRDVTERLLTLVSEHLADVLAGCTTDEQRTAAVAFVSNFFSYAPGVQQNKTAWPENFAAITPLKH